MKIFRCFAQATTTTKAKYTHTFDFASPKLEGDEEQSVGLNLSLKKSKRLKRHFLEPFKNQAPQRSEDWLKIFKGVQGMPFSMSGLFHGAVHFPLRTLRLHRLPLVALFLSPAQSNFEFHATAFEINF